MLEHYHADCVIIGGGVVGIAVARQLALLGREVWLLEATSELGSETSSRNSEVIHAGIYYPKGSLKATLCVEGRRKLYNYCELHNVPFKQCGKLIVATNDEQATELDKILAKGRGNDVEGLEILSGAQLKILEPELSALSAIRSPSTGIIDSHQLMLQLKHDAEQSGAQFVFNSPVVSGEITGAGIELLINHQAPFKLTAKSVVNSAGLDAVNVLSKIKNFPSQCIPAFYMAKGNYFSLPSKAPFNHLIYPVPEPGGLGIHLTLDLAGQARFGPDVEWVTEKSYPVDVLRKAHFEAAIQQYWPTVPKAQLQPAYAGIRPKLSGPDGGFEDFMIQDASMHGVSGLVNLLGIESPGLTSSLSIAEYVATRI
ncbi:NAD(P)/FAD-dependent oxidoreductase [Alkalimarinus alittae]|uniref:NAD(P)/FAD-dependent oxidoreductase n=1 Tax=Alkalimarinus alittae TaxID=2961619 RepID=A0ABY6N4W2_9ALTE|nr:NAD(P)/FAD-dependent oxidoreductase [Alkalimarinus alittae]UZE97009.1 NAD(P)/FAD-dependent oxidoreductase [Alkalimarinus alittae]